jgi:hypothetical protein
MEKTTVKGQINLSCVMILFPISVHSKIILVTREKHGGKEQYFFGYILLFSLDKKFSIGS